MTKLSIQSLRLAGATALVAAILVPTTLFAQSKDAQQDAREGKVVYSTQLPAPSRAVCEQAKRDAWFLRQLQIPDVDPSLELPIREDCRALLRMPGEARVAKRDAMEAVAKSDPR